MDGKKRDKQVKRMVKMDGGVCVCWIDIRQLYIITRVEMREAGFTNRRDPIDVFHVSCVNNTSLI